MPKPTLIVFALFLLTSCEPGPGAPETEHGPAASTKIPCTEAIRVASPAPGEVVTSPLTVVGEARGTWYFEASFPVRDFDLDMNELAVAPAQAQGEWMTEDFVPFEVTLPAFTPQGPLGYVFFQKDNPSDEPDLSCSVVIPVQF